MESHVMGANENRTGRLLAWQWSLYRDGHRERRNLAIHAAPVPLFLAGTCALVLSPFVGTFPRFVLSGGFAQAWRRARSEPHRA